MAETIDLPDFYHRKSDVAEPLQLLTKSESVLALLISNLGIAFFTRLIVMADDIASSIVAIHIILEHLVNRVAILVVKFPCIFVKDVSAFCIGYILELTFVGNIERSCFYVYRVVI